MRGMPNQTKYRGAICQKSPERWLMINSFDHFLSKIKRWYKRDALADRINEEKNRHASFPNFLYHHENLVKYIPELQKISNQLNELFYVHPKKSNESRRFAELMTIRIRDYYETVILCIDLSRLGYSYSVLPLMRAICESLILLRYVEMDPTYIIKLLETEEDGERVGKLRNIVNDKKINKYYKHFSNLVHVNPISVQLTYEKLMDEGRIKIHQIPPNYEAFNEDTIRSLIDMMNECLGIIGKLQKDNVK